MTTTDAGVARTAAATIANKRRAASRAAQELAARLEHLDDELLAALAAVLVAEAVDRGLAVADLRDTGTVPPVAASAPVRTVVRPQLMPVFSHA